MDSSLPLALIQWDSALAVNYPARAFGIKRGDSFQEISNKSAGKCIAIHLPILSITEGSSSSSSSAPSSSNSSMEESYENEFCLPPQKQAEAFEREKNQLRRQSEGKASLERYRLASCRIFSVLLQVSFQRLIVILFTIISTSTVVSQLHPFLFISFVPSYSRSVSLSRL